MAIRKFEGTVIEGLTIIEFSDFMASENVASDPKSFCDLSSLARPSTNYANWAISQSPQVFTLTLGRSCHQGNKVTLK
jgi:hypothetical protein